MKGRKIKNEGDTPGSRWQARGMKILKQGRKVKKLQGTCQECKCKVECAEGETQELVDRDTQPGMATRHVKCPNCGNQFLWVK